MTGEEIRIWCCCAFFLYISFVAYMLKDVKGYEEIFEYHNIRRVFIVLYIAHTEYKRKKRITQVGGKYTTSDYLF